MSDVHSAIASGYPEAQRHKLYLRLAKSYLKLGLPARARPALLIAKSLLKEHGVTKETELKETGMIKKPSHGLHELYKGSLKVYRDP